MVDESLPVNWKKGVEMFGEEGLMSALNDFEPFSFDKSRNNKLIENIADFLFYF